MRAFTGTLHGAGTARSAGISVVCSPPAHQPTRTRKSLFSTRVSALGPDRSRPDVETPLLSGLTTIGLVGTIAVTGARLCGIQVFNLFHWERDEILYALGATIPLLVVELLLFAPRWSIPTDLLDQRVVKQETAHDTAHDTVQRLDRPQPLQLVDMSAVKNCSLWSLHSWQLMLALYKSVQPQTLTEQVPKVVVVGSVAAREISKELFLRGFLLYALAHWMIDRLHEAGFDDVINIMGDDLTVKYLGFWMASCVLTAAVAPAINPAAAEAAECVSGALLLQTEAGQALAARARSSSAFNSSRSKQRETGAFPTAAAQPRANTLVQSHEHTAANTGSTDTGHHHHHHQQQPAADKDHNDDEEGNDVILDPEVLEYRLLKTSQECVGSEASKLAYAITWGRELARPSTLNSIFVMTGGNLAATLTSSLLLSGMLLLYAAAAPKTGLTAKVTVMTREQ